MKGVNGIPMQVNKEFHTFLLNFVDDWNSLHKEKTRQVGKKLGINRATLTLAKLFKQRGDLYNLIINADIKLEEN
jgi:hypothetical protein